MSLATSGKSSEHRKTPSLMGCWGLCDRNQTAALLKRWENLSFHTGPTYLSIHRCYLHTGTDACTHLLNQLMAKGGDVAIFRSLLMAKRADGRKRNVESLCLGFADLHRDLVPLTALICECSAVPASHNCVQFLRCEQITLQLYSPRVLDFPKFSEHISDIKWCSSMQLHKVQLYSWRKALNAKKKALPWNLKAHQESPSRSNTQNLKNTS